MLALRGTWETAGEDARTAWVQWQPWVAVRPQEAGGAGESCRSDVEAMNEDDAASRGDERWRRAVSAKVGRVPEEAATPSPSPRQRPGLAQGRLARLGLARVGTAPQGGHLRLDLWRKF